jgi:hypothetical protein
MHFSIIYTWIAFVIDSQVATLIEQDTWKKRNREEKLCAFSKRKIAVILSLLLKIIAVSCASPGLPRGTEIISVILTDPKAAVVNSETPSSTNPMSVPTMTGDVSKLVQELLENNAGFQLPC